MCSATHILKTKKLEQISMYRLTISSKTMVRFFLQFLKLCDKPKYYFTYRLLSCSSNPHFHIYDTGHSIIGINKTIAPV